MQCGLSSAPAIFQCLINDIFREMLEKLVIVYVDNILIYSPNKETHVKKVLARLLENQLYIKRGKYLYIINFIYHQSHSSDIS